MKAYSFWLFFITTPLVAQPLLWPMAEPLEPTILKNSQVSLRSEVERFYNDEEGYAERQSQQALGQYCFDDRGRRTAGGCVGVESYAGHSELTKVSTSTELNGSQGREFSKIYLSGYWFFDNNASIESQWGLLDSGYATGFVKLNTDRFAIWAGQDSTAEELSVDLDIQLTSRDQRGVSIDNITHLGPYVGASFKLFDHNIRYQQTAINHLAIQAEQWQISPMPSGLELDIRRYRERLDTPLYFDGALVSRFDNWQSDYERTQQYVGWRWEKAWFGLYQDRIHMDADAYLRLSDKSWNSVESDSVIDGALLSTIHAIKGDAAVDLDFLSLRIGRQWQWENVTLSWDNLIGDIQVRSSNSGELRVVLLSNQYSAGDDEFSDTLWVPKITLNYHPNNWHLAYTFQQIVPFSEVRKLLKPSSTDSNETGNITGSNTEQRKAKNWLWPQVGGYHQITLSYQW